MELKPGQADTGFTDDTIFDGRVAVKQPASGYRFSIDALLLADFAPVCREGLTVELGAGCGVISLAMSFRPGQGSILAVELQPGLAECARSNLRSVPPGVSAEVLQADWSSLNQQILGGAADCVVSNPPYRRIGSGRVNPDDQEAVARHELAGSAASAVAAAARIIRQGGRLAVVYPVSRLAGMFRCMFERGFEPKRLQMVHSRQGEPARLFLLEARFGGGEELRVEPPVYIYRDDGGYTEGMLAILSGERFGMTGIPPAAP